MADTATLFNQNLQRAHGPAGELPEAADQPHRHRRRRHGGLDDGADARAIALRRAAGDHACWSRPAVGIIGVGEGSTPWLRGFFDGLGIEESEWMPACNATYKCGITFDRWSTRPGFESYFHPFASMLDNLTMPQFVHNIDARLNGADVHAHPNRFFIAADWRASAWRPSRSAIFRSTSGTAITSMPCCSASSCTRRRCSAACVTRAPRDRRHARRARRHPPGARQAARRSRPTSSSTAPASPRC